jgi:hypothetical protein
MCWRTIGALASEVIEDAMLKAMGTAGQRSYPRPRPPAATTGEESALRIETEAGQDAHLDRMHPSRRGYYVIRPGTAGHGHAPTGMWKSIAVNPPPKTPPRPAIDSQMLVVFRSRQNCILPGSSTRPQRIGVVAYQQRAAGHRRRTEPAGPQ